MKAKPKHVNLLFVTRTSPFPGDSGSGAYVFDLLQHLSKNGFRIHTVWTEPPDLVPSGGWYEPPSECRPVFSLDIMGTAKFGRRYWKSDVVWLPFKARASHVIKSSLQRFGLWWKTKALQPSNATTQAKPIPTVQPSWGSACTEAEIIAIHQAIHRFRPDVVLANYAWMAPAVRVAHQSQPPFAVLTHDVRHRQLHLVDGKPVEILNEHMSAQTELASLQSADAIIAIQSTEGRVFERLLPGKKVVVAPMPVRPRPLPVPAEPTVLFVGSQHGPNITGLHWFIKNVWPLIRQNTPLARLLIAGSVCREFPSPQPEGVEVLGRLPDLASAYARASVVIAPILQGSGIKIKILEAASFGRACVTTSVGLEGLESLKPALRVADTPNAFAAEVTALLDTPTAAKVGDQMLALARSHLSVETCYKPAADLLRSLASPTT